MLKPVGCTGHTMLCARSPMYTGAGCAGWVGGKLKAPVREFGVTVTNPRKTPLEVSVSGFSSEMSSVTAGMSGVPELFSRTTLQVSRHRVVWSVSLHEAYPTEGGVSAIRLYWIQTW